ncbi:FecCD family ABC transporter permease [Nonomuraea sp. NPDC050328]|uniref:FecCD family ABC transporter permease n=1 Tax=Nonomuraea sp. NPDC050328 TaxID=3364361 RepID=UPI0037882EE1
MKSSALVLRPGRRGLSARLPYRLVLTWLAAMALAAAAFALTVAAGSGDYAAPISALWGVGEPADLFVVQEVRLPRAVAGLLAGAAFGLSGAIFQTATRNPLASPDMLGITQGAGTAVAAGVVFGAGLATQFLGLAGALVAGLLIYLLAWDRGTTGYRVVLVGIGVSWMCVSATAYLVSRAEQYQAARVLGWLVGSLNERTWSHAWPPGLALAVLLPVVLLLARTQRALHLGDDIALGLGVRVQRARLGLLLCGSALAAFATAAAGPVLFVSLAAPLIARRLAGSAAPPLTASAAVGAAVVLAGDLISQRLLEDSVLPVGVVTGVLGAPFLLWRLGSSRTSGR